MAVYELRRATMQDGPDVYDMLQEIDKNENGFMNGIYGASYQQYRAWLKKQVDCANGIGLESWMVPQTSYWLYYNGRPVAFGKLRHHLTDLLRKEGGHIGYAVRSTERAKGHGTALLKLMLAEARKMGIDSLLITIRAENLPSRCLAERCGGALEKEEGGRAYYWASTRPLTDR